MGNHGSDCLDLVSKQKKLQTIALLLPLVMLWVTSTTVFSQQFARLADNYLHWPAPVQLEDIKSALQQSKQEAIAIVILGGTTVNSIIKYKNMTNETHLKNIANIR
jgi:hypothetical protein